MYIVKPTCLVRFVHLYIGCSELSETHIMNCVLKNRTRIAFEVKLQKTNKSTDLRIPPSLCTMFNVLVDAKKQTAKLCILDGGQEVSGILSV